MEKRVEQMASAARSAGIADSESRIGKRLPAQRDWQPPELVICENDVLYWGAARPYLKSLPPGQLAPSPPQPQEIRSGLLDQFLKLENASAAQIARFARDSGALCVWRDTRHWDGPRRQEVEYRWLPKIPEVRTEEWADPDCLEAIDLHQKSELELAIEAGHIRAVEHIREWQECAKTLRICAEIVLAFRNASDPGAAKGRADELASTFGIFGAQLGPPRGGGPVDSQRRAAIPHRGGFPDQQPASFLFGQEFFIPETSHDGSAKSLDLVRLVVSNCLRWGWVTHEVELVDVSTADFRVRPVAHSLLAGLGLQLANTLMGGLKLDVCTNCNSIFSYVKGSKNPYCSDEGCQRAYANRRQRESRSRRR